MMWWRDVYSRRALVGVLVTGFGVGLGIVGVEWWLQVFVFWFVFGFGELKCCQLVYDMYKGFLLVNSVIREILLKIIM